MKTVIVGVKSRGVTSNLRASFIPALLSLPLCFTAGCAVSPTDESGDTATQAQAVNGGCEVQLPTAWSGWGVTCIEDSGYLTIWLEYDQTYYASASGAVGFGRGAALFRCTPGPLVIDDSWCVPSDGGSPL
jgi:hypothetical protein